MKHFFDSDYSRNKKTDKIVYSGCKESYEVSLEDYLYEENFSDADFYKWKYESDICFKEISTSDRRYEAVTISMEDLSESMYFELMLTNNIYGEQELVIDKKLIFIRNMIDKFIKEEKLTEIQKRRFTLYYKENLNLTEIAKIECVAVSSVKETIDSLFKRYSKMCNKYWGKSI